MRAGRIDGGLKNRKKEANLSRRGGGGEGRPEREREREVLG